MKIWAKTLLKEKITRDCVYERNGKQSREFFEGIIRDACEQIDVPCPVVLLSHYANFTSFNTTKFTPFDFVESVDFEFLKIENITED